MSDRPLPRRFFSGVLSLLLATGLSCGETDIKISLTDPNGLKDYAAWVEFDLFEGQCPPEEDLASGTYGTPFKSQIVGVNEELQLVGTVSAKEYGFAVLLRSEDCAIVGYGCTKANLEKVREIKLKVNPTYVDDDGNLQPVGACEGGTTCEQGRCTDGSGGEGGSSGSGGESGSGGAPLNALNECEQTDPGASGCKMEPVGWGELPPPSESGSRLVGPGIVATGDGFVVGYAEVLPDGSSRRFVTVPIQANGCYGTLAQTSFEECPDKSLSSFETTLGAAWNNNQGSGLFGFSRPPCSEADRGGGIGLVRFSGDGTIEDNKTIDSKDFPSLKFASQGSLSAGIGSEEFRVVYLKGGLVQSFSLSGVEPAGDAPTDFFAEAEGGPVASPAFGVSARDGSLFVQATSGSLADSTTSALLRVTRGNDSKFFKRPAAKEMALRVAGSNILVASRAPDDKVEWAVIGDDGAQIHPPEADSNTLLDDAALGFDAGTVNDRAIFVTGKSKGFRLSWFNNLSEASSSSPRDFNSQQYPPLASFDGKQIVVAAGGDRVAVAWISPKAGPDEPAGGVAIFKCE